ncbi:hypothetical protein EYR36_004924 [Pleurotus pulmonarius]|nr:hypothetical protein EYR36_004924 [Pleurotus pulmonarius]
MSSLSTSPRRISPLPTPTTVDKRKEREIASSSDSDSASDSESDSLTSSDEEDDEDEDDIVTPEYLEALLEKSRQNARLATKPSISFDQEEDILILGEDKADIPLPILNPGPLPSPYLSLNEKGPKGPAYDPEVKRAELATSSLSAPAPPMPPPELSSSGKPLTKKERKALKKRTAGPGWFDLPAPTEADLPRLHREVEALRLRNQLDPKRFYRKDEGEGKGIKGLPKYFAIGTVLPTDTPFDTPSSDNLPKSHRKRTIVDELVDDAEAKRYAKKKFGELQIVREARGRKTLAAKKAARRQKW